MIDYILKYFDRYILLVEAILIVIDLILFGNARVGMTCYWCVVALYHLTEMVLGKRDGE